jgi:hypothetical protein
VGLGHVGEWWRVAGAMAISGKRPLWSHCITCVTRARSKRCSVSVGDALQVQPIHPFQQVWLLTHTHTHTHTHTNAPLLQARHARAAAHAAAAGRGCRRQGTPLRRRGRQHSRRARGCVSSHAGGRGGGRGRSLSLRDDAHALQQSVASVTRTRVPAAAGSAAGGADADTAHARRRGQLRRCAGHHVRRPAPGV